MENGEKFDLRESESSEESDEDEGEKEEERREEEREEDIVLLEGESISRA